MASEMATSRAAMGWSPSPAVSTWSTSASTAKAVLPETRKPSPCRIGCCPRGATPVRRIADQGRPARIPPLHRLQQRLPDPRKHVHVLMSVDVVGWSSHCELEAVELAADLGPDLVDIQEAEQGAREEAAQ